MLGAVVTVAMFLSQVEAAVGRVDHAGLRPETELTQQAAADILNRAGFAAVTTHPDRPIDEAAAKTILCYFMPNRAIERKHPHKPKHKSRVNPDDE